MLSHDTLLLASGSQESRQILRSVFEEGFNLLEAGNLQQTALLLEHNHACIAAVILDTTDPEKLDVSALQQLQRLQLLNNIPVVVLTPPEDTNAVAKAFTLGAIEAMGGDCDHYVLLRRVQNIVELHRHKWHLEELVEEQADILRHANDSMVDVLSSIIEYRSVESGQHILRIRRFTKVLLNEVARSCPEYGLTDAAINIISGAAALHDIGKISIPDAVLNKPGPLDREEWEIMKGHALTGAQIIEHLGEVGNQEYLRYAYNICRSHHERWDGSGYPDGLAGDDIPICAQAVGLADAYDALTTRRVYKDAIACDQAATMICNGECGVFSPKLLECFKNAACKFAEIARAYADGKSPKSETFDTALPLPSQEEGPDALYALSTKYQMLLHYMDCAVVEVDHSHGHYHVVYNPDPYLGMLNSSTSLQELDRVIMDQAVSPEDKIQVRKLVEEGIPRLLSEGLLKLQHRIPVYSGASETPQYYDLILLRQSIADRDQSKLIVIWKRANESRTSEVSYGPKDILRLFRLRNDRHLTVLEGLDKVSQLTGYSIHELNEQFGGKLMDMILPEEKNAVRQEMAEQLLCGMDLNMEFRIQSKLGTPVWVLLRGRVVSDERGEEIFIGMLLDISASMKERDLLHKTLERHQIILSQTENVLYEWDVSTDTLTFSNSWELIFGYKPVSGNLIQLLSTGSHFHPEDVAGLFESIGNMQQGADYQVVEARIAKADGRYLWCRLRSTALRDADGNITKLVGIIINIDEEKRSVQAIQERAERDSLTRLLNKDTARQQAENYLTNPSGNAEGALFIIDLDDFKQVNDRYGHLFGDAVLAQVAKEIRRLFRPHDIVARIGGDEFMVLMRGVSQRNLVESRCVQLVEAFRNVFRSHLHGENLSCSVGVALFPQHGSDYSELFRRADQALYQAKDLGKDAYKVYDSEDSYYRNRLMQMTAVNARIDSDDQSSISGSNIVHYAFRHLYESGDVERTIREILDLVGNQTNVSRVYIFENSPDNLTCSNTFEWCNDGIEPQLDFLQNVSYEEDIPNFMNHFDEHGIFYCSDVAKLPQDLREILEPQNIKSILMCAIRDNGVFRGYVGFDECSVERYWTKEQIDALTYLSEVLSVFLLKKRSQDESNRRAQDLESLLNSQNDSIYVIDPESNRLLFMNDRAREVSPEAKEGMQCFRCLMDRSDRCPDCPASKLNETCRNATSQLVNKQGILKSVSAREIHWGGRPANLVISQKV